MSNPARGMYQQLRAHDRAIEKASLRVHERVVEQSKANAALAVRSCVVPCCSCVLTLLRSG